MCATAGTTYTHKHLSSSNPDNITATVGTTEVECNVMDNGPGDITVTVDGSLVTYPGPLLIKGVEGGPITVVVYPS